MDLYSEKYRFSGRPNQLRTIGVGYICTAPKKKGLRLLCTVNLEKLIKSEIKKSLLLLNLLYSTYVYVDRPLLVGTTPYSCKVTR